MCLLSGLRQQGAHGRHEPLDFEADGTSGGFSSKIRFRASSIIERGLGHLVRKADARIIRLGFC
jgi:hypothetical protein